MQLNLKTQRLPQPSSFSGCSSKPARASRLIISTRASSASPSTYNSSSSLAELLSDFAARPQSAALLRSPTKDGDASSDAPQALRGLAAGDFNTLQQYAGTDPQGMLALSELLAPHVSCPEQQQALSTAAATAAAVPPQLTAHQQLQQLLQQAEIRSALINMRVHNNPNQSRYTSNSNNDSAVSRSMQLLSQVLEEDQHTRHVVELLGAAGGQLQGKERPVEVQQQPLPAQTRASLNNKPQQQQSNAVPWRPKGVKQQPQAQPAQQQQQQQRARVPARTSVIARSSTTDSFSTSNSNTTSSSDSDSDDDSGCVIEQGL